MSKQIDEIMDHFDFRKVADVMEHLGWEWFQADGRYEVPTESEIRARARELLQDVLRRLPSNVSTCGFRARSYEDGDLTLEFVLEEWTTGDV